jgi:hypothetical protein
LGKILSPTRSPAIIFVSHRLTFDVIFRSQEGIDFRYRDLTKHALHPNKRRRNVPPVTRLPPGVVGVYLLLQFGWGSKGLELDLFFFDLFHADFLAGTRSAPICAELSQPKEYL